MREIHDFLRLNTASRFNWSVSEQTHSPSFIPMTSREWNSLPPRPSSWLHKTFSLSRSASTGTLNFNPIPKISYSFRDTRVHPVLQKYYLYGAISSYINIITKKSYNQLIYYIILLSEAKNQNNFILL